MIEKALANLVPNADWVAEGDTYAGIQWLDEVKTKPTEEAVTNEVARLNAELVANAYQEKRASEYKELKEQLDLLYHDMTADKGDKTGEWYKHIKAVKDANPKE